MVTVSFTRRNSKSDILFILTLIDKDHLPCKTFSIHINLKICSQEYPTKLAKEVIFIKEIDHKESLRFYQEDRICR